MRPSTIIARLTNGTPALITTLHVADPSIYEMTSLMGFDGIWMDLEHHPTSLETASTLMRAARVGGSDIIARPGKGEFARMARMLEAGAHGIMYPRCDGPEEAAEVVRWAKFAPLGERPCDGAGADAPYCSLPLDQYVQRANEQTLVIIQIEHERALRDVEAIAAIDGVDALMLGPADYSVIHGFAGQMDHPILIDARERIAAAAANVGKHWAATCGTIEDVERNMQNGARLLFYGADILMIKHGLEQIQSQASRLGFGFDNRLTSRKHGGVCA